MSYLENTLGELLKHRRVLIQALDTDSQQVREKIEAELETTDVLVTEIRNFIDKLNERFGTN